MNTNALRPKPPTAAPAFRWRSLGLALCWLALGTLLATLLTAAAAWLLGDTWAAWLDRRPLELVRHAERRVMGHPRLEQLAQPTLVFLRRQLERPAPSDLPTLGKGVGAPPTPAADAGKGAPAAGTKRVVLTSDALYVAVQAAQPGDVIELAPGRYTLPRGLHTARGGTALSPIVLRGAQPGTVQLLSQTVQAIVVAHPHWTFEHLALRGECRTHSGCEHAFHVVGPATGTVLRHLLLEEFNAHVKVNGENGRWPDHGLLQHSTLVNHSPRNTAQAVTFVDLVGASHWRVLDNHISSFAKLGGDGVAYGMFAKGGGQDNRFERNLVVCSAATEPWPGLRVGISVGGGLTGQAFCRDGRCTAENQNSAVVNNVVAHCNDAGLDVNASQGTLLAHNTLVNTQGVLVRGGARDTEVRANVVEGRLLTRQGSPASASDNLFFTASASPFQDADRLDLRWRSTPTMLTRLPAVPLDFCGQARQGVSPWGATQAALCHPTPPTAQR